MRHPTTQSAATRAGCVCAPPSFPGFSWLPADVVEPAARVRLVLMGDHLLSVSTRCGVHRPGGCRVGVSLLC